MQGNRYAYPVMLYAGILAGMIAGTHAASLRGLNSTRVYVGILLLVPPALIGSRLLFIASHWDFYRRDVRRIWRRAEGGGAMYGGLMLSFLVSQPLLKVLRLPLGAFWDAATITILTGMIITRAGCLMSGCCAGRPTTAWFGLYLPGARGIRCRRVPTQLLEAGLALALLLGSAGFWGRLPFDGALFLSALAIYSVGRCWLESTREVMDTIGPVRLHVALSVLFLAVTITSFVLLSFHRT